MTTLAHNSYLETEVSTASPQRLQLMLIEGAIRFAEQARAYWASGDDLAASEALAKSQQIVTQILAGMNPEHDPTLVRQVASIYLFVFRTLLTAQLERNEQRLTEAVSILEIERETWRELCLTTITPHRPVATEHFTAFASTTGSIDDHTGGFSLTV